MICRDITIVAVLALTTGMCSQAADARVFRDVDKFEGTVYEETGKMLKGVNVLKGGWYLSLVPQRVSFADGHEEFYLKAFWSGVDWIFIEPGSELVILVDGERIELVTPIGSVRDRRVDRTTMGVSVQERARFPTDIGLIMKLAAAKSAEIALYAGEGRLERKLGKGNRKVFKEFIDKIIAPSR